MKGSFVDEVELAEEKMIQCEEDDAHAQFIQE